MSRYSVSIFLFCFFLLLSFEINADQAFAVHSVVTTQIDKGQLESVSDQNVLQLTVANAFRESVKLKNPEDFANDQFGFSVALDGDTALVGALHNKVGTNSDQGAAYVFRREGNNWILEAKLTASDGAANDQFGVSVALSGDTALVGANLDTVDFAQQGSAYVFAKVNQVWTQQAKLVATDPGAADFFGVSVALKDETALVGAWFDDLGSIINEGSAYVFRKNGVLWQQEQKIVAADGAANDFFGGSVALSTDQALVGASGDNVGSSADQGSAYVFRRTGLVWSGEAKLTANDGTASDNFGNSVSLFGESALIGAYHCTVGSISNQGCAYVFTRNNTNWNQQIKLTANDGAADDGFGSAVAISNDLAIVGSYQDDVQGIADQGSAYLFSRSGVAWSQHQKLTPSVSAPVANFGAAVAIGSFTALAGAPFDDNAEAAIKNSGSISIFASADLYSNGFE